MRFSQPMSLSQQNRSRAHLVRPPERRLCRAQVQHQGTSLNTPCLRTGRTVILLQKQGQLDASLGMSSDWARRVRSPGSRPGRRRFAALQRSAVAAQRLGHSRCGPVFAAEPPTVLCAWLKDSLGASSTRAQSQLQQPRQTVRLKIMETISPTPGHAQAAAHVRVAWKESARASRYRHRAVGIRAHVLS